MFPEFKTQEEVPEQFRSFYVEQDGKWVAKMPEPEVTAADLKDVKDTLAKVREELKEEQKTRKKVEAELKEASRKQEASEAGVPEEKLKDLEEKIRADIRREVDAEMEALQTKLSDLETYPGRVRELLLDRNVKDAMLEAGVRPDRVDALFRLTSDEYDLTDSEKPMLKNHPTKALKVFMEDNLKKQYPEFFAGTQAGGGGAGGFPGGGLPGTGTTADDVLANPAAALTAARGSGR